MNRDTDSQTLPEVAPTPTETPEEILQKAHQRIRNGLGAELLNRVKSNSPRFFESLVVDLMVLRNGLWRFQSSMRRKAIGQIGSMHGPDVSRGGKLAGT